MKLFAPIEFWKAKASRRLGGCGPGSIGDWLVPDTVWGLSIRLACLIHDWMYEVGKAIVDKERADRVFRNNMVRMINSETKYEFLKRLRLRRANTYYKMVDKYGGPAFWKDKEDPNGGEIRKLEEG